MSKYCIKSNCWPCKVERWLREALAKATQWFKDVWSAITQYKNKATQWLDQTWAKPLTRTIIRELLSSFVFLAILYCVTGSIGAVTVAIVWPVAKSLFFYYFDLKFNPEVKA